MSATSPLVSVVVLSHDRPGSLTAALESVLSQTYRPLSVTVVDNPSPASDRIAAIVRTRPGVDLVQTEANLGFTGGMNRGIATATGTYTYLTEDDLILEPDCLARLVEYMQANPSVGMASGILHDAATGDVLYAGGDVSLGQVFVLTMPGRGQPDPGTHRAPFDVTYMPAGSALVRTGLLRHLGGFRDDFFMYFEDVDLCLRLIEAGARVTVVPTARIRHVPHPPGGPSEVVKFHKWKNLIALYVLHARPLTLGIFLARYVGLGMVRGGPPGERRRILRAAGWVAAHLPRLLRDRARRAAPASTQ